MLPLEWVLFIPSIIVTPLAFVALLFLRRRERIYNQFWPWGLVLSVLLCGLFTWQVLSTPDYSQRKAAKPGGFSTSVTAAIGVYLLETCVVIPAFPVLIVLAFLTPRDWKRRTQFYWILVCFLYVAILAWLIYQKNSAYLADYHDAQQQKLQQVDQFKHLRRQ